MHFGTSEDNLFRSCSVIVCIVMDLERSGGSSPFIPRHREATWVGKNLLTTTETSRTKPALAYMYSNSLNYNFLAYLLRTGTGHIKSSTRDIEVNWSIFFAKIQPSPPAVRPNTTNLT